MLCRSGRHFVTCTSYVCVLLNSPSLHQLATGWRREAAVTLCSRRFDLLPSLVRWLTLSKNVNVRIFSSPVRIGNMLTVMCLWTRTHPRLRWWQVLVNMVVNLYSSSTDYIAICLLFFPSWNYIFNEKRLKATWTHFTPSPRCDDLSTHAHYHITVVVWIYRSIMTRKKSVDSKVKCSTHLRNSRISSQFPWVIIIINHWHHSS